MGGTRVVVDGSDDGAGLGAVGGVASGAVGESSGVVSGGAGIDAADGVDAAGGADAVVGIDGGELDPAAPGILPESAAYPSGFAEYLEEVPL